MIKRRLLITGLFVTSAMISGCFTSRLYSDPTYDEKIDGVFVSSDKKTIVVIGRKYHYVFDAPEQVLAALSPELHPAIRHASFDSFKVDKQNKISGKLSLHTKDELTNTQIAIAARAGFRSYTRNMRASIPMQGSRYIAQSVEVPVQNLNKNYSVTVAEDASLATTALKIAATPITVAADGMVVIGAVVLSPIWLPIVGSLVCITCK